MDFDDLEINVSTCDDSKEFQAGPRERLAGDHCQLRSPLSARDQLAVQPTLAIVVKPGNTGVENLVASKRQRTPLKKAPVKKAKGKSPGGTPSGGTANRASWNSDLIELLIETRWSELGIDKFSDAKTNLQKSTFWSWLTKRFNIRGKTSFDEKQIKNRIDALKKEK